MTTEVVFFPTEINEYYENNIIDILWINRKKNDKHTQNVKILNFNLNKNPAEWN